MKKAILIGVILLSSITLLGQSKESKGTPYKPNPNKMYTISIVGTSEDIGLIAGGISEYKSKIDSTDLRAEVRNRLKAKLDNYINIFNIQFKRQYEEDRAKFVADSIKAVKKP